MGRWRGSGRNRDREETMPRIYYVEFFSIKKKNCKSIKTKTNKQMKWKSLCKMPCGLNDKWQGTTGTGSMNMYSVAIHLESNRHTKIVYTLYYW